MTRNPYHLRRELTAIAVLLALATPSGSHALVALSAWAGQKVAHSISTSVPNPLTPQPVHTESRQKETTR